MELKNWINLELPVSVILTAKNREYNELQSKGKLNVVELLMHIEKVDAYTAAERCLAVLEELGERYPKYKDMYRRLEDLKNTLRPALPWKMEQMYRRLEKKLNRLEKEVFLFRELVEWEHYYTSESTLKRWLKKLQNWGYIALVKKDKLTGYQYKLRFKIETN
jgi:hypothetical protein